MRPAQFAVFALLALNSPALAIEPPLDVELATRPGFPLGGERKWIDAVKGIKPAGLRIRTARPGEREGVENRGTDAAPRYHVVGLLTERNRLRLPGAEFTLGERAGIANWFEKLQRDGIRGTTEPTGAFGLTGDQLIVFHGHVSKPVTIETRGRRAGDVARHIVRSIGLEYDVTPDASRAFGRNEEVSDELKGLTEGTALAVVLRPLGLVMAPRKNRSGTLSVVIADVRELKEAWPIGWPSEESPFKMAPPLFERLNVEIKDTALSDALKVIQQRVEIPFVTDQNALARLDVDPTETKVSFPKRRASYMKIVDKLLFEAHLTSDLRVDEADTPFLWISARN